MLNIDQFFANGLKLAVDTRGWLRRRDHQTRWHLTYKVHSLAIRLRFIICKQTCLELACGSLDKRAQFIVDLWIIARNGLLNLMLVEVHILVDHVMPPSIYRCPLFLQFLVLREVLNSLSVVSLVVRCRGLKEWTGCCVPLVISQELSLNAGGCVCRTFHII